MDLSILLVQYRPDEGELRRTLSSLLRQSCRDFELVVADDGSDEDFFPLTRKILAENGFTGATIELPDDLFSKRKACLRDSHLCGRLFFPKNSRKKTQKAENHLY